MAITHPQAVVQWASAGTKSVTSATEVVSDVFTLDATCVSLNIQMSADNAGTPATGDTAVFRIRWSNDAGTTYDTAEHAQHITTLDTYATNTPGEDPAVRSVTIPRCGSHFKIGCICANAASRNITIAVNVEEERIA